MRKLVLAFGLLFAASMLSCIDGGNGGQQEENSDSIIVKEDVDSTLEVTGVAIDGAMNSISLMVDGDTIDFNYPDLDNDHRASWDINDSVTVRYYVTNDDNIVTDVINVSEE